MKLHTNSKFRRPIRIASCSAPERKLQITSDNILTSCIVCSAPLAIIQDDPTYQLERWRGICSETCAVDHWQSLGIQGIGSPSVKFRSQTSDANERLNDGHTVTPMAARSAAKQERQAKVAELVAQGLGKPAIAVALEIPIHRVHGESSESRLT